MWLLLVLLLLLRGLCYTCVAPRAVLRVYQDIPPTVLSVVF